MLENLRVRRLGAVQDRLVNVRVVAATNRDLDDLVAAGKFRSDLLYRLRVFQINLPPLRARGDDVLLLAERFIAQIAARYAKPAPTLDDSAVQALRQHRWPGNVRELRNVIERAVLLGNATHLGAADLGLVLSPTVTTEVLSIDADSAPAAGTSLEAMERQHLVAALQQAGWNVTKAARVLQISRDTLRYRIEKHGLRADS